MLPQYSVAMIIRAGFQSYDFQRVFELPKPLTFLSPDEALKWLKQLGFSHPEAMVGVRTYLGRISDDTESFRLSDHDVIEKMAALLYSRKVVIVARDEGGGSKGSAPNAAAPVVAFPLSQRNSRAPSAAAKPAPVSEPATFDPKLDAVVQAAALVAAAAEGKPFCPE
jgi:hypothetical protein